MAGAHPKVRELWKRHYPNYDGDEFRSRVQARVRPEHSVIEIGAGSGVGDQTSLDLRGRAKRVVGVDLDPRVLHHPGVDEAYIANGNRLPFADAEFDVVVHTMVAEHIENPRPFVDESARVLRPGGLLIFETPSALYYPMILSRLLPRGAHEVMVRRFGSGRAAQDVFPTYYRLNTGRRVKRLLTAAGFEVVLSRFSLPPGYLRRHPGLFALGILYERSIEQAIPPLRARMVVEATKRSHPK